MSPTTDLNTISGCTEFDPCDCETCHPLERDGTSQAQRLLAALDPSYVKVDERSLEDLLVFALNYAKLLNYYDYTNAITGDWRIFLERDISVIASVVSKENIAALRNDFHTKYKTLTGAPTIDNLSAIYSPFVTILGKLSNWYNTSDDRTLFHSELNVYFQSIYLDGYLKLAGIALGAVDSGVTGTFNPLGGLSFNSEWQQLVAATTIVSNPGAFEGDTDEEKIAKAGETIRPVFEKFTSTLQLIVDRCPIYLAESIENYPYHKPHAGLFLTFLHLFSHAQDHINGITERHLDFFYGEVLQLAQKAAVADKVHVIFELAKNVSEPFKVSADTILKAGKDATGVALFYGTDDDIIVNKAKVAAFKNLYVDRATDDSSRKITALFASTVANSSDGKGGELDKTVPQWKAFGSSQQNVSADEHTMPEARLGFAIASPQLFLSEGKRILTAVVTFATPLSLSGTGISVSDLQNPSRYTFSFTGAKKWIRLDDTTNITITLKPSGTDNFTSAEFKLTVPANLPAITAYSSKVHGGTYSTSSPLLSILLPNYQPDTSKDYWTNLYAAYGKAVIKKLELNVEVSGVQNVTLHNEFSKLDPSKPFMPFGQQPVVGSPFYIGNEEVFFKKLDELKLHVKWHGIPQSLADYYAPYDYDEPTSPPDTSLQITIANTTVLGTCHLLANHEWPKESTTSLGFHTITDSNTGHDVQTRQLFDSSDAREPVTYKFSTLTTTRATDEDVFDANPQNATRGYLRLLLSGEDFLHNLFPVALAAKAIKYASSHSTTIPKPPYTPTIKSLSLEFKSGQVMEQDVDQLFHLQPFGEQEIDAIPVTGDSTTYRYLFPQFVRINDLNEDAEEDAGERTDQRGMLYIGLENLDPQQSVSMLVQVVENSSNPKVEPPEVNWAYLRNNEWVQLSRQQVFSDTTNGFLTSGIVELDIPEDATNDNTILPTGFHWLRASIDNDLTGTTDPSGLCNVLDIRTQAIQASFRDNGNDPQHLAQPIAAATITKLDTPIAEIKSVTQPFASFGGKVREEGNNYYRRISERLRHKGRAITMWDYERLVLENYPSIYKVKCISHTLNKGGSDGCYLELAPGNVCVIVVSNLRNQNLVDPLRPSTAIGMRAEIKTFLEKRSSKFAKITVIDPAYQPVQVKCKVKYLPEFEKDKGYYDKVLVEEIKKFLSPWAYDEGADIVFGGKIHNSYIINFIEERSYVDYLTDFTMYLLDENENPLPPSETLSAANAKSILVSADTHLINPES